MTCPALVLEGRARRRRSPPRHGGADGRVVELIAGDADALGAQVDVNGSTPASCSTSAVMAARQWPQLTPGTEYVSCSVLRLMVIVLILGPTRKHTPRRYGVRSLPQFCSREPRRLDTGRVHRRMAIETTPTRGYSATKDQLQKTRNEARFAASSGWSTRPLLHRRHHADSSGSGGAGQGRAGPARRPRPPLRRRRPRRR